MARKTLLMVAAIIVIAVGVSLAAFLSFQSAPPSVVKLRVGIPTVGPGTSLFYIARESGIFTKHYIDVDEIVVAPYATLTPAVIKGEVTFAIMGGDAAITPIIRKEDLVIIGSLFSKFPYTVFAQPNIKSVQELKGKTAAINAFASPDFAALSYLLRRSNIDPKELNYVQIGTIPARLSAFETNQVQVLAITSPFDLQLKAKGYTVITELFKEDIPYLQLGLVTKRSYIAQNKEITLRFLKAMAETVRWIQNNNDQAIELYKAYTKVPDRAAHEQTIRVLINNAPRDLSIDLEAVRASLGTVEYSIPGASKEDPKNFLDTSLIDQLKREGFFDKLYKS